jgi:hypothetical protein
MFKQLFTAIANWLCPPKISMEEFIENGLIEFLDRQVKKLKGIEEDIALMACPDVFLSSDKDFDLAFDVFAQWVETNKPSKQILFFWGDGFDPDCILIAVSDKNNNAIKTNNPTYGDLVVEGLIASMQGVTAKVD